MSNFPSPSQVQVLLSKLSSSSHLKVEFKFVFLDSLHSRVYKVCIQILSSSSSFLEVQLICKFIWKILKFSPIPVFISANSVYLQVHLEKNEVLFNSSSFLKIQFTYILIWVKLKFGSTSFLEVQNNLLWKQKEFSSIQVHSMKLSLPTRLF